MVFLYLQFPKGGRTSVCPWCQAQLNQALVQDATDRTEALVQAALALEIYQTVRGLTEVFSIEVLLGRFC